MKYLLYILMGVAAYASGIQAMDTKPTDDQILVGQDRLQALNDKKAAALAKKQQIDPVIAAQERLETLLWRRGILRNSISAGIHSLRASAIPAEEAAAIHDQVAIREHKKQIDPKALEQAFALQQNQAIAHRLNAAISLD